ncbi:esterase/lipase family protein [Haloferula sp.]|uniref:esterase/lipase family protein n=1 Tax=Haloferula sp. TaxID=2497595 RepID=UPI00329B7E22
MRGRKHCLIGLLGCLFLVACSGPSVEILDRPVEATKTSQALISSGALESVNRATLRDEGLLKLYNRDRQAAIEALAIRTKEKPSRARHLALAEMSSDFADELTEEQPLAAIGRYLDAASLTREGAVASVSQELETPERTIYAYSSARIVRLIRNQAHNRVRKVKAPGSLRVWTATLEGGKGKVDPRSYDLLVPTAWLKTDGIKWKSIVQDGFGASMIGQRKATPERLKEDPAMPLGGRGFPLNARVEFDGDHARVILQDLMSSSTTRQGGKELPLSANFSAAVWFSYYEKVRRMNHVEALILPGKFEDDVGLTSLRPYDPERIPLILVHGLLSSAEAWYPFINLLLADPLVRERYQIVLFNYPTGVPVMRTAGALREYLADYQRRNDPNRSNPRMRRMVILGHSMGGMISNAQIRSSGDTVYRSVFTKRLDELDLPEDLENDVKELGFFEANPDIDRAILLAAPHRGSEYASSRVGHLGARLIRMPFDFVDSMLGQIEAVDVLTDWAQHASQHPNNSVMSLRTDNPMLEVMLECSVRDWVEIHSIIAQKNTGVPKEEGTDGYVTYASAHLDEASSEIVVMGADHRFMVEHEETIQEVWRILHLHAGAK